MVKVSLLWNNVIRSECQTKHIIFPLLRPIQHSEVASCRSDFLLELQSVIPTVIHWIVLIKEWLLIQPCCRDSLIAAHIIIVLRNVVYCAENALSFEFMVANMKDIIFGIAVISLIYYCILQCGSIIRFTCKRMSSETPCSFLFDTWEQWSSSRGVHLWLLLSKLGLIVRIFTIS